MRKKITKFMISMVLCASMVVSTGMMTSCEMLGIGGKNSSTASEKPQTKEFEVIFVGNMDGATEPDAQTIEEGNKVTKPADPTCAGYDFVGWFTDEDCTKAFDFDTKITADMVDEDDCMFIYAGWTEHVDKYTVTFDTNGGGAIAPVIVEKGKKVEKPADPTLANCKFDGWYMDEACKNAFSFDVAIEADVTIYAKWINLYTVTFETNGGTAVEAQTIESGKAPSNYTTTKEGAIFAGWYTDAEFKTAYTGGAITANTTLYAKWADIATAKTFKYTFNYNYAGAPAAIEKEVVEGSFVEVPEVTNGEMIFAGWYTDVDCTVEANLTAPAAGDMTVYAKWVEAVVITYDFNYEGAPADVTEKVAFGSEAVKPGDPIRVGNYTFAGWSTTEDGVVDVTFSEAIVENVTYYAMWNTQYVFEAEDVNLIGFFGFGFSGSAEETSCIFADDKGAAGASNGYFITCMNNTNCSIEFKFTSDRAIKGAQFTLRLSAEVVDIKIGDSDKGVRTGTVADDIALYKVMVNNSELKYGVIEFVGVPPQGDPYMPFADYTFTIDLAEGENVIKLIADNEIVQGGTMKAVAPMVDCIKIDTYANLVFQKKDGNY